ncbi:hypothetical protein M514_01283 [Trichuris suis]|uniref:Uncharacterized protein n=1 Tax=Trichuris suis TaxID=68888 RepID=A0A085MLF4_9BILA|nr:hypothetical protein M513_01283 [Trichuris suis]KFD70763.1 hypothetical protein M514_01283 [Trichuris suis]
MAATACTPSSTMLLYLLCFAAVTLTSAISSERSSPACRASEIARKLNALLEYDDYYKPEQVSHTCQFVGTTATFLTLARTQCKKKQSNKATNLCMNCLKTEKQKYLHCVIIETQETNEPLGYICERGARYQRSTLLELNRNCSNLLYDSSNGAVQVKLAQEDQPWKENLPLYMPMRCKWNSSTQSFTYKGAKEPSEDKRPNNPLGRQGISGRGKLPHLGENAFVIPIIVRINAHCHQKQLSVMESCWRTADQIDQRASLITMPPCQQSYARLPLCKRTHKENSEAPFTIPLPWIPYPSYFYQDPVGRNLTRYLHKMWLEAYEDSGHFEYFMSMEQDLIYAGPIHHRYNTDNAWLAIRFSVIDDSKYQFMSEFPSFSEFHWVNITKHQLTYMTKYYVDVKQQRFL